MLVMTPRGVEQKRRSLLRSNPSLEEYIFERNENAASSVALEAYFRALPTEEREGVEQLWSLALRSSRGDELRFATSGKGDGLGRGNTATLSPPSAGAYFLEALRARGDATDSVGDGGNLYLDARPQGGHLRAFHLLRLRTSLIPFAYAAANRALLDFVEQKGNERLTLIDIGIGRGEQIRSLLRNPAARLALKSLRVVGVEPDPGRANGRRGGGLEIARASVLEAAAEAGIPTTFVGIPKMAEQVTVADFHNAGLEGLVVANGAFAMHHLQDLGGPSRGARDRVMTLLRQLPVDAVILTEPDSNHFTNDLPLRFLFAYRHYGTVYRALLHELAPAEAALVWKEFFVPEIHNVLAHEGLERVERHEELWKWDRRCSEAGFELDDVGVLLNSSSAPRGYEVVASKSGCQLRFQGISLIGVLRAIPCKGPTHRRTRVAEPRSVEPKHSRCVRASKSCASLRDSRVSPAPFRASSSRCGTRSFSLRRWGQAEPRNSAIQRPALCSRNRDGSQG